MKQVQIRITGEGHDLNYSVSPEVAAHIVGQLNQTVLLSRDQDTPPPDVLTVSAKYRMLAQYLAGQDKAKLTLRFTDIERILGEPLKPSARKHKAWWANTESHAQATAWMHVGYQAREIDLAGESVMFQKK